MEPYLGEIKLMAFRKDLRDWLPCDGRSLLIQQYQALYAVIGLAYGGDTKNFNIPDLRGRVPACISTTQPIDPNFNAVGKKGGAEGITLTSQQLPIHTHAVNAVSTAGNIGSFLGNLLSTLAAGSTANPYGPALSTPPVGIDPQSVTTTGGSAAHNNMQPFEVLCYYIATAGIYPPR